MKSEWNDQKQELIQQSTIGKGGAYVPFPYDVREEFGKGRVNF